MQLESVNKFVGMPPFKPGCMAQCERAVKGFSESNGDDFCVAVSTLLIHINEQAVKDGQKPWSEQTLIKFKQAAGMLFSKFPPNILKSPFVQYNPFNAFVLDPSATERHLVSYISQSRNGASDKYHKIGVLMCILINHPLFGATDPCPIRVIWVMCKELRESFKKAKDAAEQKAKDDPKTQLFEAVLNDKAALREAISSHAISLDRRVQMFIVLMYGRRCGELAGLRIFVLDPSGYSDAVTDVKTPLSHLETADGLTLTHPAGALNWIEVSPDEHGVRKYMFVFADFKNNKGALPKAVIHKDDAIPEQLAALLDQFIAARKIQSHAPPNSYIFTNLQGTPCNDIKQPSVAIGRCVASIFKHLVVKQINTNEHSAFPPGCTPPNFGTTDLRKHLARRQSTNFYKSELQAKAIADALDHSAATHAKYYAGENPVHESEQQAIQEVAKESTSILSKDDLNDLPEDDPEPAEEGVFEMDVEHDDDGDESDGAKSLDY